MVIGIGASWRNCGEWRGECNGRVETGRRVRSRSERGAREERERTERGARVRARSEHAVAIVEGHAGPRLRVARSL